MSPRHRYQEFLRFLRSVEKQSDAGLELHFILDNYATHKHPRVKAWLERNPRVHFHFLPTSTSWLNLVERLFSGLTTRLAQTARRAQVSINWSRPSRPTWISRTESPDPSCGRLP